jgi:hypothetical protein
MSNIVGLNRSASITLAIILSVLLLSLAARAQDKKTFGVGTATLNPNAALQVESPGKNQGIIIPKLTTAQRNALQLDNDKDIGLIIYDTDLKSVLSWNGLSWSSKIGGETADASPAIQGLSTSAGTAIRGTNTGTGLAGLFSVNNATSGGSALIATNNTNVVTPQGELEPVAFYGNATGTGALAGVFRNSNPSNTLPALVANHKGGGSAIVAITEGGGNALFANSEFGSGVFALSNSESANAIEAYKISGGGNTIKAGHNGANTFGPGNAVYAFADGGTSNAVKGEVIQGDGHGGLFTKSSLGTGNALMVTSNGATAAIEINHGGTGHAINANRPIAATYFIGDGSLLQNVPTGSLALPYSNIASSATPLFKVTNSGAASAGEFVVNNAASDVAALHASTNATGGESAAILGETSTAFAAIMAKVTGPAGSNGVFASSSSSNQYSFPIYGSNTGASPGGPGGRFEVANAGNTSAGLQAETIGTGSAGEFTVNNKPNGGTALVAVTNSDKVTAIGSEPVAVFGNATGTGALAASLRISNVSNSHPALYTGTIGTGSAGIFQIDNVSSSADGLSTTTNGTGNGGSFNINNGTSNAAGVFGGTNGLGSGVTGSTSTGFAGVHGLGYGPASGVTGRTEGSGIAVSGRVDNGGSGIAGEFIIDNDLNGSAAVKVETNGTGPAATFQNTNPDASGSMLAVRTNSNVGGAAIDGLSFGQRGHGGAFYINHPANTDPALTTNTFGVGPALTAGQLANGISIEMSAGTLKYSTITMAASGLITQRAGVYRLTASGSYTLDVPSPQEGETCYVFNNTASPITVGSNAVPADNIKQFIYIAGSWRITN